MCTAGFIALRLQFKHFQICYPELVVPFFTNFDLPNSSPPVETNLPFSFLSVFLLRLLLSDFLPVVFEMTELVSD